MPSNNDSSVRDSLVVAVDSGNSSYVRTRAQLRDHWYSQDFFGQSYFSVIEPLLASIQPNGGVAKAIGINDKPLTETTATCLLALYKMQLIEPSTVKLMQEFLLSTQAEISGFLQSGFEGGSYLANWEQCAWTVTEGRNTWSTANALWALLETHYAGPFRPSVLGSALWLVRQQGSDGGWSLAKSDRNQSSIFLTSIVLHVLKLSSKVDSWSEAEQRELRRSVDAGVNYLLGMQCNGKPFWCYDPNNPKDRSIEPTSTTMALWALHQIAGTRVDALVKKGLGYLRSSLSGKVIWDDKLIVHGEIPDTNSVKSLQGYTPALPLALLQLGIPPTDPMILKAMAFLNREHRADGWPFGTTASVTATPMAAYVRKPGLYYVGSDEALTFTTALALWTIDVWHKRMLRSNIAVFVASQVVRATNRSRVAQGEMMVSQRHLKGLLVVAWLALTSLYGLGLYLLVTRLGAQVLRLSQINLDNLFGLLLSVILLVSPPVLLAIAAVSFAKYGRFSFESLLDWWQFFRGS